MVRNGDNTYQAIVHAVRVKHSLVEPFTPKDVRRVAPGWPYPRYFSYLANNCSDNQPLGKALFVRVARGRYILSD
ncbi:hypothetical protein DEA98_16140 [Brucella pseudogrignonensis]|uniref:Uncharacterized protein n=1 Tax=Brucella pseudogrignonensis TaxID=419475 RepID=A0A7Y3T4E6_9HYPH|nr:hypothetical protein [Brucella pseudogrignonensis]MCM0752230.1 hypothetical protein [Brucella pseudogrignonensis]NNV19970.1 hypothetical protein [Brucella pseudogrignonensis]